MDPATVALLAALGYLLVVAGGAYGAYSLGWDARDREAVADDRLDDLRLELADRALKAALAQVGGQGRAAELVVDGARAIADARRERAARARRAGLLRAGADPGPGAPGPAAPTGAPPEPDAPLPLAGGGVDGQPRA